MAQDLLQVALRNEEFVKDIFENPDVANTTISVIDRIIHLFDKDVHQAKITGPVGAREGFDVAWRLGVKNAQG